MSRVVLDRALTWRQVAAVARQEAALELSPAARARVIAANDIVRAIVDRDIRAYGVNTGVGALSEVVVPKDRQSALSHNILMSHAVGVGAPLGVEETRSIMVAAVNNFAHGYSGLRLIVVERLVHLLNAGCMPEVPCKGSVGYITHMAHIGLVLIGHGYAVLDGERLPAADALARLDLAPLVLEAKEGLCLVNGTPCATGLASLALARAQGQMDWADAIAAMVFETQRCQRAAIDSPALSLRVSPGIAEVVATLKVYLAESGILSAAVPRTQDALSLRSIPQVHGAVRDSWAQIGAIVDQELESVTDNPIVTGSPEVPGVFSQAHAVGAAMGLAMDQLAIALGELGTISERRIDRMVNPLVNGLPPFLAGESGVTSGFMIAQYTAASLVAENRRLAAPASLDGGITSGLQEDMLCHATPAALKVLDILDNIQSILAIEYLSACQSYDLLDGKGVRAAGTSALYQALRGEIPIYTDDRPLAQDIAKAARLIASRPPPRPATPAAPGS